VQEATVCLSDVPEEVVPLLLNYMNTRSMTRLALTNAVWARHVGNIMTTTGWAAANSFCSSEQRMEEESRLFWAVSCRLSPEPDEEEMQSPFGEFVFAVGEQLGDDLLGHDCPWWSLVGRAAARNLRRREWTAKGFVAISPALFVIGNQRGDKRFACNTHMWEDDRSHGTSGRINLRMCCICSDEAYGAFDCRAPALTDRQELLRDAAVDLREMASPLVKRGILSLGEILKYVCLDFPKAKAFFVGCSFAAFGCGPEDTDDWESWAQVVADAQLTAREMVELLRFLANFDAAHTYDMRGSDTSYEAYQCSDDFMSTTYREWHEAMTRETACDNTCFFLDAWAEASGFPQEWRPKERSVVMAFLREGPWNLSEIMPRGLCLWAFKQQSPPAQKRQKKKQGPSQKRGPSFAAGGIRKQMTSQKRRQRRKTATTFVPQEQLLPSSSPLKLNTTADPQSPPRSTSRGSSPLPLSDVSSPQSPLATLVDNV